MYRPHSKEAIVISLEAFVFAKPYFDRRGLIVATFQNEPIGFIHAGFGPTEDESGLSPQFGVIAMLMVHPDFQSRGVGLELLKRAEAYLQASGSEVIYAGSIRPMNPFYLGLYGGSELPGLLESSDSAARFFAGHGYQKVDEVQVLHVQLADFQPTMNRNFLLWRRKTILHTTQEPPAHTWWQACSESGIVWIKQELFHRELGRVVASCRIWPILPLSHGWGRNVAGLVDLHVDENCRQQGIATFLLAESFKILAQQGFSVVEAQTMQYNAPAQRLYARLGFKQVDKGTVLRKQN